MPAKIAFEIDGNSHEWTVERDQIRDLVLREHGWLVVGISAQRVLEAPESVADYVFEMIERRISEM